MAAAGSAVGLGNIWRFPYLAAKNGGGTFIFVYIILALTFGFTLLITEISMGRKTKQGPLTAYGMLNKKFAPTGFLAWMVPVIILLTTAPSVDGYSSICSHSSPETL